MPITKSERIAISKVVNKRPRYAKLTRNRGSVAIIGKSRPKVSKGLKKKIQSVIDSNNENKQAYQSVTNVNYNSGILNALDCNYLLPNISNSTSDNGRIGDQVKCMRLNIKGHMITNLTSTVYSNVRLCVRMMIVQPKQYNSKSAIDANATTWMGALLRKGGTVTGFTGVVSDLYAPINSDLITTYYDKLLYVKCPYVPGVTDGAWPTSQSTKFFNINLRVKNKILKYDSTESGGLLPTNYCPTLILGYSKLDSGAPDTVTTNINLSWISTLDFQDS